MPPTRAPYPPIEVIQFSRHLEHHAPRDRRVDAQLVCDAVVNGVRKRVSPGRIWFFGRTVAVLATQSPRSRVTCVLTAYYA